MKVFGKESGGSMKIYSSLLERHFNVSDDMYVVKCESMYILAHPDLPNGTRVRLISGIGGGKEPGFHHAQGYVTVCKADAEEAHWYGLKKEYVVKENSV